LSVIGVLLTVAGVVISLEGSGLVGPPTSYTFDSQTWVLQGALVGGLGLLTLALGLVLGRRPQTAA